MNMKPSSILTGVICPFRGNRWNDFTREQKQAGLNLGKEFWHEATKEKIKLIITLGNETTNSINDLFNAKPKYEVSSGWGDIKLRRYSSINNIEIIQLPHLSTFKLFSNEKCRQPLETIFEGSR